MSIDLLARLQHRVEIEELHAHYGELCDQGFPPEEIAALFAEDGTWESSPNGVRREGRAAIAEHFRTAGSWYPWSLHVNVPVRIVVDEGGLRARGTWYLLMPCVDSSTGRATAGWLAGRYDNDFERHDGSWRYRSIHIDFGLMARHHGDWAQDRFSLASARRRHR